MKIIIPVLIVLFAAGCVQTRVVPVEPGVERWVNFTSDKLGLEGCTLDCKDCNAQAFSYKINGTGFCGNAAFTLLSEGAGGPGGSSFIYCFSSQDAALFSKVKTKLCGELNESVSIHRITNSTDEVIGFNDTSYRVRAACLAGAFDDGTKIAVYQGTSSNSNAGKANC